MLNMFIGYIEIFIRIFKMKYEGLMKLRFMVYIRVIFDDRSVYVIVVFG